MKLHQLAAISALVGVSLVSGQALAQSQPDAGFYLGGGLGQTKGDIDTGGINAVFMSTPPITGAVTSADDSDTGWKVFAGYQLNRNFAVELGYANLGKVGVTTTTTPAATFTGEAKLDSNWYADILGIVPLGSNFSIFGRVGLLYSETKVSLTGVGPGGVAGFSSKDDELSWKAGMGVGFDFTPKIGLRGEWERYNVSDGTGGKADVDLFSVSLRFKF